MATTNQGDHVGYQQDHGVPLPEHAAATATEIHTVYTAARACRLVSVTYYPDAAITGADTDSTNLNTLVNTTEKASVEFVNGTNAAVTGKALYAPTTPLALAVGDRVRVQHEKVGNGLLIPSGLFTVVVDFSA
jgi:hypothetical protein